MLRLIKNLSTVNLYIKVDLFIKIDVIILYFVYSLFVYCQSDIIGLLR